MKKINLRRWAGAWVDRLVARPIISFGPNEMIGQAYNSPTTATETGFFSFFFCQSI